MSQSATTIREQRKQETSNRIRSCALALTREHGLDGWTMDDLADAAEVSRRTLFNYFPGKIDAIIGPGPDLPEAALEVFAAGGPTGRLVDDLGVLAKVVLEDKDFDRDTLEVRRHVFMTTPRLLLIAHERFETVASDLVELIHQREGSDFGVARARLLLRLVVALFDCSVTCMVTDADPRSLAEIFDESLREARELLA